MNPQDEKNELNIQISRRNFLKVSAAGIAVAGTSVVLPPSGVSAEEAQALQEGATVIPGYSSVGDWLGTAPVIADSDIAETQDVDVLIIGGGHAGLMAAVSAVDAGASVAVIEAQDEAGFYTDYWHRLGEDIGHVNSQWLIDRGYGPYDTGEVVDEFVKRSGGRVNPQLIRKYVEHSGPMFDRMVEIYESYEDFRKEHFSAVQFEYAGENARVETIDFSNMMSEEMLFNQTQMGLAGSDYPIVLNGWKTWPTNAMFQGPVLHEPVAPFVSAFRFFQLVIDQYTKDHGAKWFYEHAAVVLTQDAMGSVTGAIVQAPDGSYKKFNAAKGTLVATGDFSRNEAMNWALLNDLREMAERQGRSSLAGMGRDGYGHKLCSWAGGQIESLPRPVMGGGGSSATGPWGFSPMLQLNANAKRYANEANTPWIGHVAVRQPLGLLTVITDAKYMDSIKIAGLDHGGPNFGRGTAWTDDFFEDMSHVADAGAQGYPVRGITVAERNAKVVFGAQTLEELAGYLGYRGAQVQAFVDEIARYNELCAAGVDADFGKDPIALIPIDTAPFYGCTGENTGVIGIGLVTLAGMVTDNDMNVMDAYGYPIDGLYVAGNTLGGRYGLNYVTPFAGNSVGMALTHGWLAGEIIANK